VDVVIGGVIFVALVGGMAAWYFRRNRKTSAGDGVAGSTPRPPMQPK
jgi:hypothetical protein